MSEDQVVEEENQEALGEDSESSAQNADNEVTSEQQNSEDGEQETAENSAESEPEPEPEPEPSPLENYSVDFINIDALVASLGGANPCGESARYEEEFEGLEKQIRKLDLLDKDDPIDWGEVSNLSIALLTNKSKDLLIASYLTMSLLHTRGFKGLEAGLFVYHKLLELYWNDMFPPIKRIRGRIAAINWMVERLEVYLNTNEPQPSHKVVIENAYQLTENIREFLNNNLDDNIPDFATTSGLLNGFLNRFQQAEQKKQREVDERKRKEQQLKEAREKGGALAEVVSEEAFDLGAGAIITWVRSARSFLDDEPKGMLRAQWLNRIAAWIKLKETPLINQGKTQIAAPPEAHIKDVDTKMVTLEGKDALKFIEDQIAVRPFWLDLYFHWWKILDEMGSEFDYHKQSLEGDVAGFIGRFPEIVDAQFRSGKPLANDDTRRWLKRLNSQSGGSSGLGGGGEPWLEVEKEAKKLALGGKLSEALVLFREGQNAAQSKREAFFWRLRQSDFCLKMEQLELAIGQLEALEKEAQDYNLKEWEPQISVEVARLLLLSYGKYLKKRNKPNPEIKNKMQSLYRDICQLDINVALTLEEKTWQ